MEWVERMAHRVKTIVALFKLFATSPLAKLLVGSAVGYKAYQIAIARGFI